MTKTELVPPNKTKSTTNDMYRIKREAVLKVVTPTDDFCLTIIAQITFKKISYYLSRIFKLGTHIFTPQKIH